MMPSVMTPSTSNNSSLILRARFSGMRGIVNEQPRLAFRFRGGFGIAREFLAQDGGLGIAAEGDHLSDDGDRDFLRRDGADLHPDGRADALEQRRVYAFLL